MTVTAERRDASSQRRSFVWLLVLLVPVGLFGFWWWIGGVRLSNPLPEMRSEIERFVPPEGSELVSIEEDGLDRFCFLQCAARVVEARFALPDGSSDDKCDLVEDAMSLWVGVASSVAPGRGRVVCQIGVSEWPRHPGWDPVAIVFDGVGADGSDLSVFVSEP